MDQKPFPSVQALVLAKTARRVAGERGDLGLARAANDLHREALSAIRRKSSSLSGQSVPSAAKTS